MATWSWDQKVSTGHVYALHKAYTLRTTFPIICAEENYLGTDATGNVCVNCQMFTVRNKELTPEVPTSQDPQEHRADQHK